MPIRPGDQEPSAPFVWSWRIWWTRMILPFSEIRTDPATMATSTLARHGPLNHDVKSGVVVDCMAWITSLMAQLANPPIPSEIECPNQLTTSWPRPPRGSRSEIPVSISADRAAEVEGPGDEEDPGPDDDPPAKAASTLCWETEVRLMDPFWTPTT